MQGDNIVLDHLTQQSSNIRGDYRPIDIIIFSQPVNEGSK